MPSNSLLPWQQRYAGVDREAIWTALFTHLQGQLSDLFTTIGRKHILPPQLTWEAQPALFVLQMKEQRSGNITGTPNKLAMHGFLIVYVTAPDTNEAPGEESQLAATQLNAIFKAIDDAFAADNMQTGKFTLGGLVTHCWIEGDLEQDPGIFSSQAAAIIPVQILVP